MRKTILFLSCCAALAASPLWADPIYGDDGKWQEDDYRMGTVMPPELSIEGNVLGIYFADALTDLQVQILDARGNLLYVEMISGACGETYSIPLVGLAPGEYRVVLTHKFGWISGMFTVE